MGSHDIVTMYSAKMVEYLLAIGFLFSFVVFWRFLNPRTAASLYERVEAFLVPNDVFFHNGHAWARPEGPELVSVGMDDFAHKLVGNVDDLALPRVGQHLKQGETAWKIFCDSSSVPMASPVDGTVVAVNRDIDAEAMRADPYGRGWIIKVQAPRLGANTLQLVSGSAARQFMEQASQTLRTLMSPDLGRVQADGGVPVDGMAKAIDPQHWQDIARKFLVTGGTP
ncbi:MAG: glycine cleavage system protein H [Myxococcaceae bacterium]